MDGNESTVRRQVFAGEILKCPNCGAQITSDTAKCPSCGFIIEKKSVSSAMEEFARKFMELASDAEKKELVESYPVPNNKDDIRGFLNYASSQRDKDYKDAESRVFWTDAWNNKCRLIVNQAFDVFGADTEFLQYLKAYKAEVETSSAKNKALKTRLRLVKLGKIAAVVLIVAGAVGAFAAVSAKKKAARQELIAGCVVPKENVGIGGDYLEILSDAQIVTTAISQRVETDSKTPVWCLDTTVTVKVRSKANIRDVALEDFRKGKEKYYSSPDFSGKTSFRTEGYEDFISCAYQSQSVIKHGFDNVHRISEMFLNWDKEDDTGTFTIRLTQIAGSRKECEDLAIKLHESGEFKIDFCGFYDLGLEHWLDQGNKL